MIGILIVLVVSALLYMLDRRKLSYWDRRGIPQMKPLPLVGNVLSIFTCQKNLGEFYYDAHKKYKGEKYVGFYSFWEPRLLLIDPDVIERILVKDFSSFNSRGIPQGNPKHEVDFQISQLTGALWRGIRYKITPAFSTAKLKLMFDNMKSCVTNNLKYLESIPKDNIDFKDVSTRFSMDVIASTGFGLDVSNDVDGSSEFRAMGNKLFQNLTTFSYLCQLLFFLVPKLSEILQIKFTPGKAGEYFANIIKDTLHHRLESGEKRQDFIDHLLDIKKRETITVLNKNSEDKYLEMANVSSSESFVITDNMLISQAFTFLASGFDGLSTITIMMLHELAKNPSFQDRIREEVKEQVSKQGGALTYEALKNCSFLEKCFQEAQRIYSIAPYLLRQATKDYEVEPGVTIEAGTRIAISVNGVHKDPDFYPEPDSFHPDRFSSDLTTTMSRFTYLPFGVGPRMCFAMGMVQLVIKLFIASVIAKYEVRLSPKCPRSVKMKSNATINLPEDNLTFSLDKIYS